MTDVNGVVTDTFSYDAFGNLIDRTGNTPNLYLYAGEQYDPDLNLYYNRARYLNVGTGRFWNMDSFEGSKSDPRSLHKYLYTRNSPVDRIDPSGYLDMAELSTTLLVGSVLTAFATAGFGQFLAAKAIMDTGPEISKKPTGLIAGIGFSVPPSKYIEKRFGGNPYGLAAAIALAFTSGVGGLDFILPIAQPDRLWVYGYLGVSFSSYDFSLDNVKNMVLHDAPAWEQFQNGFSDASVTGYGGLVWNVNQQSDYLPYSICGSFNSLSGGGSLGRLLPALAKYGIKFTPGITLCSSKNSDGSFGSITLTLPITGSKGGGVAFWSGGYQRTYSLAEIPLPTSSTVGNAVNSGAELWENLFKK